MNRPDAIAALAESVADGTPVDWQVAEAAAPEGCQLVRHLRLVESIAVLHRTVGSISGDNQPSDEALRLPQPSDAATSRWAHLELRDRIGQGSSSEVYRAWDSDLHRDVALKLLHVIKTIKTIKRTEETEETEETEALNAANAVDGHAHARVLDEARRMARVRHQHVVQVYGAARHDNRVGLWMELVRGDSLDALVSARGALGAREALLVGLDICSALAAVHGAGLLHRDVKAQNVVREQGGRIVLMDFGTGEALRREQGTNRLVGTPLYLAPEIFRGQPASVQSDIYSVGVLLFYLTTARFPVFASSMAQLERAHIDRRRQHLLDLRPDLPEPFIRVVERAIDSDPLRRYRTVGELEAALREALVADAAADTTVRAAAAVERPVLDTAAKRSPRTVGLAIAAAALVAAAAALAVWLRVAPGPPLATVAVLPFRTDPGAGDLPFLADGLTDQVISTLGGIGALRVTSRTSVAALRDSDRSAREIGAALGVGSLLEGSVAMTGAPPAQRIRVSVRLIAAGTEQTPMAHTFERASGDSFAMQAEIARSVAAAVGATVTSDEAARLDLARQTPAAAEQAYFQGRVYLAQYGSDSARDALEAFQRALAIDPLHAAAHAGAAFAYLSLGAHASLTHPVARASALAAARRALELDDRSAEAHAASADIAFLYDWAWADAEQMYRLAIELNPSYSYARRQYASWLAAANRLDDARREAAQTSTLDPLSAEVATTEGLILFYARDYTSARTALERATALDPTAAAPWMVLSRVAEARGQLPEAVAHMERGASMSGGVRLPMEMNAARLWALSGERDRARAAIAEVERQAAARNLDVDPQHAAYVALALGDPDRALALLERAVDRRVPGVLWLAVDPRVDPLRSSPRFTALLGKIGPARESAR